MRFIRRGDRKALGLWRTTAARLTLLYGVVFAAGVFTLLGLIYVGMAGYLTSQMDQIVLGQAHALVSGPAETLPDRIAEAEGADSRHVNYYGLFSADGVWITGNVRTIPPRLEIGGAPSQMRGPHFQPGARGMATRLPWGEILIVGFDAKTLTGVRHILIESLLVSGAVILIVGLTFGAALSLGPLARVQDIQRTSRLIMDGDLSARLPVTGRGDEIDTLAGIANAMMAEVERLLGEVQHVGHNVAHDLRTPATRLRALLYRATQSTEDDDPRRDMLEQALKETDALLSRFRALQRIAQIDRRERRAGFAEDEGHRFELEIAAAPPIQADRELLFEALGNLIGNAIKFTPTGGRVLLALEATPEGPRIAVVDSGPGVPAEERASVLQRFYRSRRLLAAVARLHEFRLTLDDMDPGLKVSLDCWPTPQAG
jgi:signal transduction histidine kinase